VCIPIVMWLSDRALRSDAGRFVREVASRETWAEGGNTLLSEAILGFHADDPFEPRRYDVVDPHGEIVGSIDATARSTSEYTFVARDAGGIGFTVSARRLRGRWSATVSDGRGNQVGNLVQASRPLHKLYVAGFAAAIVVLALVLAAPFVLSGDAVNDPAPAPLVYVGTVALVLAPVLGISLFTHRHVVAFRFICTDGTVGRFVPGPTEEVALHLDMVGEDGRCLARASRVWEEGLPRRLFAGASMVVRVDPEANTRARMIALAAPVVVGLVQPPGTGAARAGERVMNAWEAGGRAVEG
jgi:hypothetical protein